MASLCVMLRCTPDEARRITLEEAAEISKAAAKASGGEG